MPTSWKTEVQMDILALAKRRQFQFKEDSTTALKEAATLYRIERLKDTRKLLDKYIQDPVLGEDDDIAEETLIEGLEHCDPYTGEWGIGA